MQPTSDRVAKNLQNGVDVVSDILDERNKKGNVKQYGHKYLYSPDEVVAAYDQYVVDKLEKAGYGKRQQEHMRIVIMRDFEEDFGALLSIFKRYLTQH